jgi:hypothetical protein
VSLTNATITLAKPANQANSSDPLVRDHIPEDVPAVRCRMTPLGSGGQAAALGMVSVDTWTCRVVTDEAVAAGWSARVIHDDWDESRPYRVTQATKLGPWRLVLQGTGV